MKPVDQTTFGVPGGNCMSACIASILELPIEEVPYFMGNDIRGGAWKLKLKVWLAERGLYPLFITPVAEIYIPRYHIMQGKSPRGRGTHAVVAKGDRVVWDPHPSRAGIRDISERTIIIPEGPLPTNLFRNKK